MKIKVCKLIFFLLFSFSFLLLDAAETIQITDEQQVLLHIEKQNDIIRMHLDRACECCEKACHLDCERCRKKTHYSDSKMKSNDQLFDEIRQQLEDQMFQDMGDLQGETAASSESTS